MSSDSSETVSTGSRVRQFGLYRTIDARTEEFLRLSKKRQIRQGCACAAVSTAITVTIVVSVLLIYEYSLNSDFHLNKNYVTKPNWFGWINDSDDATPFQQKYSKIKLNFDKTTLKLLPMLLNALNRNKYLDTIIDDYSSSSPTYEGKDTTEFTYKKDVFNDARNWYKMPTSRLYAIEYKTAPVVYYRSPAQNVEYFKKIRKIRDYQRILNYFDKMISDKIGYNSGIPTMREKIYKTKTPPTKLSTVPMKSYITPSIVDRSIVSSKNMKNYDNKKVGCKCPKKLGELLTKLISSVSQLLPYATLPVTLCKEKLSKLKPKSLSKFVPVIYKVTTTSSSTPPTKIGTNSLTTVRNIKTSTNITEENKILENNIFHFPLYTNVLKPVNQKLNTVNDQLVNHGKSIVVKDHIKTTETEGNAISTTTPLNMIWKNEYNHQSLYQATARKDYLVYKSTIKPSNKIQSKFSVFDENEYDDYFATTPNNMNDFDMLDILDLGLVKEKMISPIDKEEKLKIKLKEPPKSSNENTKHNTNDLKSSFIKKMKNENDSDEKKNTDKLFSKQKSPSLLTIGPKVQSKNLTRNDQPKNNKFDHNASATNTSNKIYMLDQLVNNENAILEDDKILLEEEFQEIDNSNQTIHKIYSGNKTETKLLEILSNNSNNNTDHQLTAARFEDTAKTRNYNSMLPEDRPIYLEIHRNEWRQDEHQDYDMNFNNNIFDLTNP